jgi:hypothetical protein
VCLFTAEKPSTKEKILSFDPGINVHNNEIYITLAFFVPWLRKANFYPGKPRNKGRIEPFQIPKGQKQEVVVSYKLYVLFFKPIV